MLCRTATSGAATAAPHCPASRALHSDELSVVLSFLPLGGLACCLRCSRDWRAAVLTAVRLREREHAMPAELDPAADDSEQAALLAALPALSTPFLTPTLAASPLAQGLSAVALRPSGRWDGVPPLTLSHLQTLVAALPQLTGLHGVDLTAECERISGGLHDVQGAIEIAQQMHAVWPPRLRQLTLLLSHWLVGSAMGALQSLEQLALVCEPNVGRLLSFAPLLQLPHLRDLTIAVLPSEVQVEYLRALKGLRALRIRSPLLVNAPRRDWRTQVDTLERLCAEPTLLPLQQLTLCETVCDARVMACLARLPQLRTVAPLSLAPDCWPLLSRFASLRTLRLYTSATATAEQMEELLDALRPSGSLTSLSASLRGPLGCDMAAWWPRMLRGLPQLQSLELHSTKCSELLPSLADCAPLLRLLRLTQCSFVYDSEVQSLRHPLLERLLIQRCGFALPLSRRRAVLHSAQLPCLEEVMTAL